MSQIWHISRNRACIQFSDVAIKMYPWTISLNLVILNELPHDKTNEMACAPSEDLDQPGHLPSLTRVFAVRLMGSSGPKLSSSGQRRLRSDWADAQADLSLHWAHLPFCLFCHDVAHVMIAIKHDFQCISMICTIH